MLREIFGESAALDEVQGRIHEAAQIYRQIIQHATQPGGELPFAAIGYVGLGKLFRQWNDLHGAVDHLVRATALGQQSGIEGFTVDSSITLALVRMAEGDHASALALIQQAAEVVRGWNNPDSTLRLAALKSLVVNPPLPISVHSSAANRACSKLVSRWCRFQTMPND
jgi:ATP/maltotriose-dependent transcriptional regulator MalT